MAPSGMAQLVSEAVFFPADPADPGGVDTWTDISQWVQSATITRASTREQGPVVIYEGGTSVAALDNSDARFTPENLAGPYVAGGVTGVRQMIPVRHSAIWNSVTYRLCRHFAQSFDPGDDQGPDYAVTTLAAADGFLILAGVTLPAAGAAGANELTGARVQRILTAAGWYDTARGMSSIAAGSSAVQATTLGATALDLLQVTAASEIGALYVDEAGALTFKGRHDVVAGTGAATVQAVLGDRPGTVVPGVCSSPPLNGNADFAGGIAGWTAGNSATLAASVTYAYGPKPGVMSVHGNGSTANPRALSTLGGGVNPGSTYTLFAVTYTPVATAVQAQVDWKQAGGAFISSSVAGPVTTASPWTVLTVTAVAPALTGDATLVITLNGTPSAGTMLYVGYASLIAGAASAAATERYYSAVTRPAEDLTIANDVQATVTGGTMQQVTDSASVARFLFRRTYSRSDLILQADADALNWARYVAYVTEGGQPEFDTVTLTPSADPDNLWPLALGLKIGDRVQVWRRPPGMTASPIARDCLIRGITHVIGAGTWDTTFLLQDATRYAFLILDNPVLGRLGFNALGF